MIFSIADQLHVHFMLFVYCPIDICQYMTKNPLEPCWLSGSLKLYHGQETSSSPKCPNQLWGPPSPIFRGYCVFLLQGQTCQSKKQSTYIQPACQVQVWVQAMCVWGGTQQYDAPVPFFMVTHQTNIINSKCYKNRSYLLCLFQQYYHSMKQYQNFFMLLIKKTIGIFNFTSCQRMYFFW